MTEADVLVVGAGPTGLTAALQAHAHGASVRVVERREEEFRPSRAMVMHPRTMESLRPLGVTEPLMARADTRPRAELHLGGRCVSVEMRDLALPDTAFPHLTLVRQMDVEEVLAAALERRGVRVERGVELEHVEQQAVGPVRATLRSHGRTERLESRFLVGADGQASTVRQLAGIRWDGAPYHEEVVLADLELSGDLDPGVLHAVAGRDGLLFLFALGEGASWRLLATRPSTGAGLAFGQPGPPVPARQVQWLLDGAGLPAAIEEMRWSARVPLQHRLAGAFRRGNLFLAGDAAHAHSPAGAQGMNTGMLDAVNLGWKLAFAPAAEPGGPLLASYESERRPLARMVLGMTHLIFFAEASGHPAARFLRGTLAPFGAPALPLLLRRRRLLAEGVRTLSWMRVGYRRSPVSYDAGPRSSWGPRPGDRLPDADLPQDGTGARLHDLTAGAGVHVLLGRDAPQIAAPPGGRVSVHRLTGRPGRDVLAVRPDGVVGFRAGSADGVELAGWLRLVGALV